MPKITTSPTRAERIFSRKFVKIVARHYRRSLKRKLGFFKEAHLEVYNEQINKITNEILIEARRSNGGPSIILDLSQKQCEAIACKIVENTAKPANDISKTKPNEAKTIFGLATLGISAIIEKISEFLELTPDKNEVDPSLLKLILEQEFEDQVDLRKKELLG